MLYLTKMVTENTANLSSPDQSTADKELLSQKDDLLKKYQELVMCYECFQIYYG